MQRPQNLRILPEDVYPTERLTKDEVDEKNIKSVANMSEMAEFVYNLYMSKMEQMKGTLPTEEELRAMHKELPNEDDDDDVETGEVAPTDASEEPPQKRAAKDSTSKKSEGFKPTPIVNEIFVDEDAEMAQKSEETTEKPEKEEETPKQTES